MKWVVQLSKSAQKELAGLEQQPRDLLARDLRTLASELEDPGRPVTVDSAKLKGQPVRFKLKIHDYRALYTVAIRDKRDSKGQPVIDPQGNPFQEGVIAVYKVGHRRAVYD